VTQKGQGREPNMLRAQYLENGWRHRLGDGPRIGNGYLGIKWSRDRWYHMTQKGQGRDPIMFDDHYLENGWIYRLGCNGVLIGNGVWRVKWSGARCRRVCRTSYLELIAYCHTTFITDKIAWKYRKQECPAVADKPARRERKVLQFDVYISYRQLPLSKRDKLLLNKLLFN